MKERIFEGLGMSPGVAIGKAFVMEMAQPVVWMHRIREGDIEDEIQRFRNAIERTKKSLSEIKNQIGQEMGPEHAYIFDAHLLMLDDPILIDGTIGQVREKRVNAEFALQQVTGELSRTFSSFEDTYLKERGVDVLDVANRIQWQLTRPKGTATKGPDEPSILLAHEIPPSKLASMDVSNVLGIAMDVGGQTTHTGLLATAWGIPAVVGLRDISVIAKKGETVIVDGSDGVVIISPTDSTLEKYRQKRELYLKREEELVEVRDLPSVTTDGVGITMLANIELKEELEAAFGKFGAQGVGLYRSEFIFLSNPKLMPTELDHADMYSTMARIAGEHPINMRTVDLGGEKNLESLDIAQEPNPALGLRAVRYGLQRKSIFKAQLRGALRAGVDGNLRIMIPMISGVGELREVRALLEECQIDLAKEGVPVAEEIPFGVMIEVPSAGIIADIIAREVDFVSVGTNDLIQYLLAIDRGNESVAYLYEPFHPAVLRLLSDIAQKVNAAGKPLSMCGEMAADPAATALLIGMGYHELSMNPANIPVIKSVVRSLNAAECRDLAKEVLQLDSVDEIELFLRQKLEQQYPDIENPSLIFPKGEQRK